MRIGKLTLQLARPDDLDEQLLESTGCSAEEIRGHLAGPCPAGAVAAALLPFVQGERPVRHTLAEAIAAADIADVRRRVLALYGAAPTARKGRASGKAAR